MQIQVDFYNEVVYVTSPTSVATVQEFVNAIRAAEDTPEGISFGGQVATLQDGIADAEGKVELRSGVDSGVIMTLHSNWYIEFWDGVLLGIVEEGNIAGGLDNRPIRAAVGSADTVQVLGAVDTTIVGGGGGATAEEIADAVWDEDTADHTSAGTFGERLQKIPLLGKLIATLN